MLIVLIEDDKRISDFILKGLEENGHFVTLYRTDEDFIEKARWSSLSSFSRKRKLSVSNLVLLLLGFSRIGVRHELEKMFNYLYQSKQVIQTYSKSAFSQYRHKLQVSSLVYLMREVLRYFETHAIQKHLWNGYRLIAIDGSSLNLPHEASLKERFGSSKNQTGMESITARISIAYEVMNKLVLDACIDHMQVGENDGKVTHFSFTPINRPVGI